MIRIRKWENSRLIRWRRCGFSTSIDDPSFNRYWQAKTQKSLCGFVCGSLDNFTQSQSVIVDNIAMLCALLPFNAWINTMITAVCNETMKLLRPKRRDFRLTGLSSSCCCWFSFWCSPIFCVRHRVAVSRWGEIISLQDKIAKKTVHICKTTTETLLFSGSGLRTNCCCGRKSINKRENTELWKGNSVNCLFHAATSIEC